MDGFGGNPSARSVCYGSLSPLRNLLSCEPKHRADEEGDADQDQTQDDDASLARGAGDKGKPRTGQKEKRERKDGSDAGDGFHGRVNEGYFVPQSDCGQGGNSDRIGPTWPIGPYGPMGAGEPADRAGDSCAKKTDRH